MHRLYWEYDRKQYPDLAERTSASRIISVILVSTAEVKLERARKEDVIVVCQYKLWDLPLPELVSSFIK